MDRLGYGGKVPGHPSAWRSVVAGGRRAHDLDLSRRGRQYGCLVAMMTRVRRLNQVVRPELRQYSEQRRHPEQLT